MEWKTVTAEEYCHRVTDGTHDSPKRQEEGRYLITSKHLSNSNIDFSSAYKISEEDYQKIIIRSNVEQYDILFSMIGTIGNIYRETNPIVDYAVKNMAIFKFGGNKEDSSWFYYWLKSPQAQAYISQMQAGSTQGYLTLATLRNFPISVPDKETQNRIVSILSSLDAKIENNNRINANLEAQAQALYKSWFVDFDPWGGVMPEDWKEGKAEEFFEINIGKTPPRKEKEWFTTSFDKIWVSISDMANCGVFIADSSEYLTADAVKKFNVVMVPQNTVLLSFKLTIGRVAIAQRELTTNEAIARFILPVPDLREYLYLYLHSFNYSMLGSTSSIATAVNSKIIKQMQMVMPTKLIINNFHQKVKPLFDQIAANQKESQRLAQLRDTLLPKLMKGEAIV